VGSNGREKGGVKIDEAVEFHAGKLVGLLQGQRDGRVLNGKYFLAGCVFGAGLCGVAWLMATLISQAS